MTDWFRSWHGAPTDNKWLLIGRRAGVAPGIVSAVFWALLDHASQSTERGKVDDFDTETYATFSGFEEDKIIAVLKGFTEKKLIVNGWLVSWEKRQPNKEDPGAAERKRQQRSRLVTQGHAASRDVTLDKSRVEEIRTEEEKVEDARARGAALPKPKRQPKLGTALPENLPSQADLDAACSLWCSRGREDLCAKAADIAAGFRDYHAAKGTVSKDWAASFRTWVRKAIDYNKPEQTHGKSRGRTALDSHLAGIAMLVNEGANRKRE